MTPTAETGDEEDHEALRLHPDSTGTLSRLSEVVHWAVDKGRHVSHGTYLEGQTERKV